MRQSILDLQVICLFLVAEIVDNECTAAHATAAESVGDCILRHENGEAFLEAGHLCTH